MAVVGDGVVPVLVQGSEQLLQALLHAVCLQKGTKRVMTRPGGGAVWHRVAPGRYQRGTRWSASTNTGDSNLGMGNQGMTG